MKRKFQATEQEFVRRIGLWYLKGVVWQSGSVTNILERDIVFRTMLTRGFVRQGIDTDKDSSLILESRILITQELIHKASEFLKNNCSIESPSAKDIDNILLVWLGPTSEEFNKQNQEGMHKVGLNQLVDIFEG